MCARLTVDTLTWTNLELPLSRHDLGVGTRDSNTSVQASLVVSLDNVSAENLAGTVSAVVWTLRTWETALWPSVRPALGIEKSVFLLKTEPETLLLVLLHDLDGVGAEVEGIWSLVVRHVGLGHDEDVVAEAEWAGVESDWLEVDIRVVTWSLVGGGTVKVPFWQSAQELCVVALWDFWVWVDGLRGG